IRDFHVTGVQTCALPIFAAVQQALAGGAQLLLGTLPEGAKRDVDVQLQPLVLRGVRPSMDVVKQDLFGPVISILTVPNMTAAIRSEERRVGKDGRACG